MSPPSWALAKIGRSGMREPEGRIRRGAAVVLAICWIGARPTVAGPAGDHGGGARHLARHRALCRLRARAIDPKNLAFAPQYPLWTDGAAKRRWISLPPGTAIDASDPDNWVFPVGTRLWKEFAFGGRPVETRFIERLADGAGATPPTPGAPTAARRCWRRSGLRGTYDLGGGRSHSIPSVGDCKVCHEGRPTPIIGFSLLQLSPDRDPKALHADPPPAPGVDLPYLVRAGLLTGLPQALLTTPPRIEARSPTERAALGYLHGNCGHCHARTASCRTSGSTCGT